MALALVPTRKVSLSTEGRYYLEKFAPMLGALRHTIRFLNENQREPEGLLRITAPVSYGTYRLQRALTRFQRAHPNVELQVFLKNEYVDMVAESYDMAIRIAPLQDSGLVAKKMDSIGYRCVASEAYLESIKAPRSPQELESLDCIGLSPTPGPISWSFSSPAGNIQIKCRAKLVVNDPIYAKQAAISGLGIAYLPDFLVSESIHAGLLRELLPAWSPRGREVYAVYHHRTLMPLALKKLLEQLNQEQ